jgi:regulator of PEP synthase PpsR (kinase-PPPase family)
MANKNQSLGHPPIFVVSGGKGLAGDAVVQSVLIQFPNNMVPVIINPDVLNLEKVQEVVEQAVCSGGIIVHTMVDPDMRQILIDACKEKNVTHFDLVGNLSDYLSGLLHKTPISKPGLYRLQNIEYFQRVEAIEFTLNHDDGQHAEKIEHADIVLTGVSRTGKTPLSVYLAMFGWKVANVPLVQGIDPPQALFAIDKNRVFGLDISVRYLIAQRGNRMKGLNIKEPTDYINPQMVRRELDYAESIFRRGGFTVLNITNKPIESSANEILTILTDRFGRDDWKKKPAKSTEEE